MPFNVVKINEIKDEGTLIQSFWRGFSVKNLKRFYTFCTNIFTYKSWESIKKYRYILYKEDKHSANNLYA